MKKTRILAVILMLAMLVQIMPTTLGVFAASTDTIVLYPEYDERIERDYMYRIYVKQGDGQYEEIPVYNSMKHSNYYVRDQYGTNSEVDRRFCQFSATPSASNPVTVKVVANTDFSKVSIIPSIKGITPTINANVITFNITEAGQYVFRLNDNNLTNLAIFADSLETAPNLTSLQSQGYTVVTYNENNPAPNKVSRTGKIFYYVEDWQDVEFFELKSNQQLYIAPGAVLNSRIQIMGGESDINISGRGMLRDFNNSRAYNADTKVARYYNYLFTVGSSWVGVANLSTSKDVAKNVTIKDIVLYDATGFNLVYQGAVDCTADNIKIVSNEISTDGVSVWSSKNITVKNSFIYNADNVFVIDQSDSLTLDNLLLGSSIAIFFPQGELRGTHKYKNINVFRSSTLFEPTGGFTRPTWESGSTVLIENLSAIDCVASVGGANTATMGKFFSTFSNWSTNSNKKNVTFRNVTLPAGNNSRTVLIANQGSGTTNMCNFNIVLENVYADNGKGSFDLLVYDSANTANNNITFTDSTTNTSYPSTLSAKKNNNVSYTPVKKNTTAASYTANKTYLGANNWTGVQYYSPTEPYVKNNVAYVSAKTAAEKLGFNTYFDEDDKSLTIYDEDVLLRAVTGSNVAAYNDKTVTLSAKVEYGEEVMVPIDFFSKTLGIKVSNDSKKITIGNYDRAENLAKNGDVTDPESLEDWDTISFARIERYLDGGNYVMRFSNKSVYDEAKLESFQGTYQDVRSVIQQNGTGVYRITFRAKCNEASDSYDLTDTASYYIFSTIGTGWMSSTTTNGSTKQALKNTWTEYTQDIVINDSSIYNKNMYLAIIIKGKLDVSVDDITFTKISEVPSTSQTNTLTVSGNSVSYGTPKTVTVSGTNARTVTLSTTSDYLKVEKSTSSTSGTVTVNYPSNYARTAKIVAKNSSGTVVGSLVVTIPATSTEAHVLDYELTVKKDTYTVGETFNNSDVEITNVKYNYDNPQKKPSGFTVTGADFTTGGEKTVTITHDNKSVSYTVTVTAPEPTEDANLRTLGANIRIASGDLSAGVRFAAMIDKNAFYDKYYPTTDADKKYVYSEDNNYQFGAIMLPKALIPSGEDVISMFQKGSSTVLEVAGKRVYAQDDKTITFTGVLTGIPETVNDYTNVIQTAFYVRYRKSATDEWKYIFSTKLEDSYYSVATRVAEKTYNYDNIPNPTPAQKATIEALAKIIDFVKSDGWIDDKWW